MSSIDWDKLGKFILRLGVAFAFLYPPIDAWIDPYSWIGYFPDFMRGHVPDMVLLHSFGVLEIFIALWIIWGKNIFWPCILATLLLVAIVIFNRPDFIVVFRDLTIATAAFSLAMSNIPGILRQRGASS